MNKTNRFIVLWLYCRKKWNDQKTWKHRSIQSIAHRFMEQRINTYTHTHTHIPRFFSSTKISVTFIFFCLTNRLIDSISLIMIFFFSLVCIPWNYCLFIFLTSTVNGVIVNGFYFSPISHWIIPWRELVNCWQ